MNDFTGRHSQKNAAMKSHHSVILISSATRIRTWKMLESESSALPFGDSPLPQQMVVYIIVRKIASVFLKKFKKICKPSEWLFWLVE